MTRSLSSLGPQMAREGGSRGRVPATLRVVGEHRHQAGRDRLKVKHCVWERELPAGSHARLSCSPVSGWKAGGLRGQSHPGPKGFSGKRKAFLHVFSVLFQF